ncbi:prephenate dehydratase [Gordonia rubripertincta]|uniref:Prephenate dehydratase n=2 Tax=Gordonia rubripertincta TaxID=36822 RepID=A0AAW6R864_GORRU|nr:prephenate dehydratase [Gordonia rubripertincta]MDG6780691.1 prephenate dehydratase [Gordonia rubripertincta]NKY63131.1 prephenate dehydratase [Gordonia rubripertincta]GAB86392.1 prephenate dehydratase [Gordonia rubripertincta NBRC 101908]
MVPVIAYFGPPGTFTEMALDAAIAAHDPALGGLDLSRDVTKVDASSPAAAIAMVRSGEADYGCVPIESSLEGSVPATMDALVPPARSGTDGRVQVFAETVLDIAFAIAANGPIAPEDVRTIAAYPVAAAQVRQSVAKLFPNAEFVTSGSNAAAALDVASGKADAAVTTGLAAGLSDLTVIADGVCDAKEATTRFLVLGRPAAPTRRTGTDRTSVILDLSNEPGSLMNAMNEFASRGIDLTRIESRPQRDEAEGRAIAGRYRFFLDAVGHIDDAAVAEALAALHRRCERVVYLGSWPAVRTTGSAPPDHAESLAWIESLRQGEV